MSLENVEPSRPLKWVPLLAPEAEGITLVADAIVWRVPSSLVYRQINPPKKLLLHFLRLHTAGTEKVLDFAKRWGCLALCEHGLPATHNASCTVCLREPVNQWRALSRQAASILRIRDTLSLEQRPAPDDWKLALSFAALAGKRRAKADLDDSSPLLYRGFNQNELGQCVQAWLDAARIGPRLTWSNRERRYRVSFSPLRFWYPNLFSHLAMELMLAVADVGRLAVCFGCGREYAPSKRRPAEGRRNFCESCGRKAAVRLAVRRFRSRARQEQG
jgi:hypothetical protein